MADLSSYKERKKKKRIVDLIDEAGKTSGYPRYYIGLSGLGNPCLRKIWFDFRWFKKGEINGRTNRIFRTGHLAEHTIIEDLESIGIKLWNILDDQYEFVDCYGYAKGHPDGFCINVPTAEKTEHLAEFKTMNDKAFKDVVKNGVKKSKPIYYAQMALYMYKKELTRALFVAINKNDSSYYIERVKADNDYAKELLEKGNSIVFSEDYNDFPRIGNNSKSWYECKWCNYIDICFGDHSEIEKNCRNCNSCNLIGDGKFACGELYDKELNLKHQEEGCEKHTFLECIKK